MSTAEPEREGHSPEIGPAAVGRCLPLAQCLHPTARARLGHCRPALRRPTPLRTALAHDGLWPRAQVALGAAAHTAGRVPVRQPVVTRGRYSGQSAPGGPECGALTAADGANAEPHAHRIGPVRDEERRPRPRTAVGRHAPTGTEHHKGHLRPGADRTQPTLREGHFNATYCRELGRTRVSPIENHHILYGRLGYTSRRALYTGLSRPRMVPRTAGHGP